MNRTVAPLIFAALAAACATPRATPSKAAPTADRWTPAAAPSHAAPAAPPMVAAVALPTGPLSRVGGIVVSEDASARTLTLKDYQGRTRTFRIADSAKMTKGGGESAVGLDGVSAGDRVRLEVGGDVAASVHVLVKPAS
jgi:hypothetical protein